MMRAAVRLAIVALTVLVAGCGGGDENVPVAASETSEGITAPAGPSEAWDLVVLGDSVPTGAGDAGAPRSFPEVLATRIASDTGRTVHVTNLAGGGTSGELRVAIEQSMTYREAIAGAEIVTISIGGNDLFQAQQAWLSGTCRDGGCYAEALATFAENWEAIVTEVVTLRQPDEAMLRVTNVYDPLNGSKVAQQELGSRYQALAELTTNNTKKLNSLICDTANRAGMLCADVYTVFNGNSGHDNPHAKGLISEDGVHPSIEGHRAIAATIARLGSAPFE